MLKAKQQCQIYSVIVRTHLSDVGEDNVMLSLVQHSSTLGEVRVHTGVIHEVVDENVQTT